jgi:hypothetical protein
MNLDEFLSETLKGIIKGVRDAQEFAKDNDAVVNPYLHERQKSEAMILFNESGYQPRALYKLQFDIALTASEETGKSGHGGINVMSIKLGGELSSKGTEQTVSRVQFPLYVVLPSTIMPFRSPDEK